MSPVVRDAEDVVREALAAYRNDPTLVLYAAWQLAISKLARAYEQEKAERLRCPA